MIERKVYQCEHCKIFRRNPRVFFSKDYAHQHERNCFYNIERKTCFTCKHKYRGYKKPLRCHKGLINESLYKESDNILVSEVIQVNCKEWKFLYEPGSEEDDE